jgi:hypothetical protein
MKCDRPLHPLPLPPTNLAVQEVQNKCAPVRERSWALRGLSEFYREDAAALCALSYMLIGVPKRTGRLHGGTPSLTAPPGSAGIGDFKLAEVRLPNKGDAIHGK